MKNREGQRRLDVWVDEEVYRQLKVYEALHDLTHEQALNRIIADGVAPQRYVLNS